MKDRADALIAKYAGKTVLGLGAHPDDLELGAGGTLALLSRAGARVVMAVATIPTDIERRKEEAQRAAAMLGAEVRFIIGDRCSRVEDIMTYEWVDRIDDLVRELKPAALLSHGPSNFHKDHVMIYNACIASQRINFFDFFCYYPTSCRPIPAPFNPQAYVDISEVLETKMDAIGVHSSQFACRGLGTDYYREVAREFGRLAHVPYAEGLEVVRLRLN
jgi:N-acetylglucosamine malate deacetylase 1